MRSLLMTSALIGAALTFGASAFAADDWDLNHREQWLQERVDRGLQDGSLGADEAKHVRQDLEQIHSEQVHLQDSNGGELMSSDSDRLEERLDHVARQIRWLKQDNADTPPWPAL
jgi:polyhydroxyalkanoate synthesis regulator phasin